MDEAGEPGIGARSLILCRRVEYDMTSPGWPYTLHGVQNALVHAGGFPGRWREPVWLYVEFFGAAGEYEIWFDLIRYVFDTDGDVIDEDEQTVYGPFVVPLTADVFVLGRGYCLRNLPLSAAGVYEFRVKAGGGTDVLTTLQFVVKEEP